MQVLEPATAAALVGTDLGASDWVLIDQAKINAFAEVTGDHQFIHVNPELAEQTPFGTTIAHGYLTLSLLSIMAYQAMPGIKGTRMGVNYGLNKVRFMAPVPVGAKLRAGVKVLAVDDIQGGAQVTLETTFEAEGAAKPSCVAEVIFRYYSA
jgi:acyl dehydratase